MLNFKICWVGLFKVQHSAKCTLTLAAVAKRLWRAALAESSSTSCSRVAAKRSAVDWAVKKITLLLSIYSMDVDLLFLWSSWKYFWQSFKRGSKKTKWYFSGINRSEEKYFRFCCVHGKVKVVRNQVYRRSKVVLGVLRVLSTLVVGFSVKKGPILLLKLRKVIVFFCELRKTLFSVLTRKKRTFLLHQEMGPFLLNTQQHRWTTLAHQELPCSCDKLDFWQPLLLHGRSNSGNIFSLDL